MKKLIYDRTELDVINAKKNPSSEEYLKGNYNYTDLNRLEEWINYLQYLYNGNGKKILLSQKIGKYTYDDYKNITYNSIYENKTKTIQEKTEKQISLNENRGIKTLKVFGKSEQETRSGKNKLNNVMENQTLNGVTFIVNSNKSIAINGTAIERTEPKLWTNSNGSLTLISDVTYYNYSGTTLYFYGSSGYFSISNNSSYKPTDDITISYIYIRVEAGEVIDKIIYPMLTTSTDSTYEPYGVMPSLEYPSKIKSIPSIENLIKVTPNTNVIKNGVTITVDKNYVITLNGTCVLDNSTFTFDNEESISLDGTYTLSCEYISGSISNATSTTRIQLQNKTDWTGIVMLLQNNNNSITETLTKSLQSLNIRFDSGVVFDNYKIRVQLEKDSVSHPYVPCGNYLRIENNDGPIFINLQDNELCSIGDVPDELIIDENCKTILKKYIKRIESYNDEEITTDYISTTGNLTTGAEVYYILEEPEEIELEPIEISTSSIINIMTGIESEVEIEYYIDSNLEKMYFEYLDYGNWEMTDIPTLSEINRIRGNIEILKNNFVTKSILNIIYNNTMNYIQANILEQILSEIDELFLLYKKSLLYCGTFSCGEELLR